MAAGGSSFLAVTMLLKSSGVTGRSWRRCSKVTPKTSTRFGGRRLEIGIDLDDCVLAPLFIFENFERFRLVARSDDAVRNFAGDQLRGGHVHGLGQGDEIAKRTQTVSAARAGIGGG